MEKEIVANIDETYSKTGWKAMVSPEKGLKLTVDWYRDYHLNDRKDISQGNTVI